MLPKHLSEDFLHYVWRYQLFNATELQTTDGQPLQILQVGNYNTHAGPDFLAARLYIGAILWAGNIEIHKRTSDWTRHNHSQNKQYDSVILHVVYENDQTIQHSDQTPIPCLELKDRINSKLLHNYLSLKGIPDPIPCRVQLPNFPSILKWQWLVRLTVERLQAKIEAWGNLPTLAQNDWENTFFLLLARSFGLTNNTEPMERIAASLPVVLLAKHKNNLSQIEALLFGQAGFLEESPHDDYMATLQKEYQFLRHKHQLTPIQHSAWRFLRMRPPAFPTVRLAQLSALIHRSSHLWSKVLEAQLLSELEALFHAEVSEYWQSHYVFGKVSTSTEKGLSRDFVHLIIINTIIPLLFLYGKLRHEESLMSRAIAFLEALPPEKNTIITEWKSLKWKPENAAHSQAILHLYKHYCTPRKCLECAVGQRIMKL